MAPKNEAILSGFVTFNYFITSRWWFQSCPWRNPTLYYQLHAQRSRLHLNNHYTGYTGYWRSYGSVIRTQNQITSSQNRQHTVYNDVRSHFLCSAIKYCWVDIVSNISGFRIVSAGVSIRVCSIPEATRFYVPRIWWVFILQFSSNFLCKYCDDQGCIPATALLRVMMALLWSATTPTWPAWPWVWELPGTPRLPTSPSPTATLRGCTGTCSGPATSSRSSSRTLPSVTLLTTRSLVLVIIWRSWSLLTRDWRLSHRPHWNPCQPSRRLLLIKGDKVAEIFIVSHKYFSHVTFHFQWLGTTATRCLPRSLQAEDNPSVQCKSWNTGEECLQWSEELEITESSHQ